MRLHGANARRLFQELSIGLDKELVGITGKFKKIPIDILLPAVEATRKFFKKSPDKWKKREEMYCKDLCGQSCDHFEEGEFRVQFRDWQKAETQRRKNQQPQLSEEYKRHLKTPEHLLMVRIVISSAGGKCQGCFDPAIECHHRRYLPETWGTPEEIKDMIAVCRKCHNVLDRRRNNKEV